MIIIYKIRCEEENCRDLGKWRFCHSYNDWYLCERHKNQEIERLKKEKKKIKECND